MTADRSPLQCRLVMTPTAPAAPRRALLLQDFVDLAIPSALARDRCCAEPGSLASLADQAWCDGDALMVKIGPSWAHGLLSVKVVVSIGPCRKRGDATVMPIEWRASEHSSLFPVLSGDLELCSLGDNLCRITLSDSYLPPLGELGMKLDRALLHRVAQSTVRSFLQQLASSLGGEELAAPSPPLQS